MISLDSDPSGNSILQDWYRASGKTPGFRRIRVFSLSITENHGKNHRQHTASGHELSTWSWIWFISFKKIFWETLWAIWFFLLRFVKWGVSPIWGKPLFWWGLCKIVQPPFVRLSYEGKAIVNQHGKRGVSSLLGISPKNWGDTFRIGQPSAANLTHPCLKKAPFLRLKIQSRNYDAGGTNPEMR